MAGPKLPTAKERVRLRVELRLRGLSRSRPLRRELAALKAQTVAAEPAVASPGKRKKDLDEHLANLRPEFAGRSALCLHHAELIVRIRRGIELGRSLHRFFAMWRYEADHLAGQLNSRWLIAALDTYGDYGTPAQAGVAMMQVALFNTLRLAETERLLYPAIAHEAPLPQAPGHPRNLWDGIVTYSVQGGDVVRNTLQRMRRAAATEPALLLIFNTLLNRAAAADNLLTRLAQPDDGLTTPQ